MVMAHHDGGIVMGLTEQPLFIGSARKVNCPVAFSRELKAENH